MSREQQRTTFNALGRNFSIDKSYTFTKELGQGAYGCVVSCQHSKSGQSVAVKQITNVFSKTIMSKRALREIKLLRHFRGHKNITCLYDMDIVDPASFNEIYLYEELMEADLHAIIRSGQPLTDQHYQSFLAQCLCALKYIHSANVLHRDLKPGNLLLNADCELKVCDFGLARGFDNKDPKNNGADAGGGFMTEYVATRWYRAPEIMLSFANYTASIDLWSVGCILAELLGGKPIFKGRDYVDQLNQILAVLGTPSEDTLRRVASPRAQEYIRSLPITRPRSFAKLYPNANPLALDLLSKLLIFDPSKRITCEEALAHPYLATWHDPAEEPVCQDLFDFSFEAEETTEGMRKLIVKEVSEFRAQVRSEAKAAAGTLPSVSSNEEGALSRKQESLPSMPSRKDIQSPSNDETKTPVADSPLSEDPAVELEKELAKI